VSATIQGPHSVLQNQSLQLVGVKEQKTIIEASLLKACQNKI